MKILIVRFSSIGDIVLTSPVIRVLSRMPGAEVHYLTKTRYADLVRVNPNISKVYAISASIKEVAAALRQERYDHLVDLHVNLRSFQLRWMLRVKVCAFQKLNIQKWLLTALKIDVLPRQHIVDRYLRAVAKIGAGPDGEGLDFFIPNAEEIDINEMWPSLCTNEKGYIAFCIGATHATKRLPEEKIREVCTLLPLPVVLLGGADMAEVGEMLEKQSQGRVLNACGKLSIHQSASVLRQSAVVVTHDTGLMHIAAALKKPIVSVWGNTVPQFGMTPYFPQGEAPSVLVEADGLSCRPCSKIGYATCPKGHFKCMLDIRNSQIAKAVHLCLGQSEN